MLEFTAEELRLLVGISFLRHITFETSESAVTAFSERCEELSRSSMEFFTMLNPYYSKQKYFKLHSIFADVYDSEKAFKSIWKFCTGHLGISTEQVFDEFNRFDAVMKCLLCLAAKLQSIVDEFSAKLLHIKFDPVVPHSDYRYKTLMEYIHIAKEISASDEVTTFERELFAISDVNFSYTAFSFIGASSGAASNEQAVYGCFETQSKAFHKLLDRDLSHYQKQFGPIDSKKLPLLIDDIDECKLKFESIGFLLAMARVVVLNHQNSMHDKSALIQVDIQELYFLPLTTKEAQKELAKFMPLESGENNKSMYKLPIFFDECSIDGMMLTQNLFLFLRGVVRCMKCIPVLLGTDARPSNFLGSSLMGQQRSSRTTDYRTWCLIWHRLPKLSTEIKEEKVAALYEELFLWRTKSSRNVFPTDDALNSLYIWLENERPLFFFQVYKTLILLFTTENNFYFESDLSFFEYIMVNLLTVLQRDKSQAILFNHGQLAYMAAGFWHTDIHIHHHLAMLSSDFADSDHPYYSKITALATPTITGASILKRFYVPPDLIRENELGRKAFTVALMYEPFSKHPITGLMIAGIGSNNNAALCGVESQNRVSVMNANLLFSTLNFAKLYNVSGPKNSGTMLEYALLSAFVLASRVGKFYGTDVAEFVNHLCIELDMHGSAVDLLQSRRLVEIDG